MLDKKSRPRTAPRAVSVPPETRISHVNVILRENREGFPGWLPPAVARMAGGLLSVPVLFPAAGVVLPPAVARQAEAMLSLLLPDAGVVRRLATDGRMEAVWRELARRKANRLRVSIIRSLRRHGAHGIPADVTEGLSNQESALAIFFYGACHPIAAVTTSELATLRSAYLHHAAQLRASAEWLHKVTDWDKRPDPPWAGRATRTLKRDIAGVEAAAAFCERVGAEILDNPAFRHLIVARDHGNAVARGYVLGLARLTQTLFSAKLRGSLATVASVALGQKVTLDQVRYWCQGNKSA